eukprot:3703881-Rhodomonas_salina.1
MLDRALVDCIRYAGLAVPSLPDGAILGCIHTGRHAGKWVWLLIWGPHSVRAAVCMVPLGRAAARPDWTLDHADLLRMHPLLHQIAMHPTLMAWNRLKAEAEPSLSEAGGVE